MAEVRVWGEHWSGQVDIEEKRCVFRISVPGNEVRLVVANDDSALTSLIDVLQDALVSLETVRDAFRDDARGIPS